MNVSIETCPHCEREVYLAWNAETDGYKAYCPYCGNRLMLCSELDEEGNGLGTCDYNSETDTCKYNRKEA